MNTAADLALHLRLVAGDPTAVHDCIVRWLPDLVRMLSAQFSAVAYMDQHFIHTAAHDALMEYTSNPYKYDPQRASLKYYLLRSARGDLLNALRRDNTQRGKAISIELVEQSLSGGNISLEEHVIQKADARAAWNDVLAVITDPLDRRMLALMLQGERATAAFVEVLGARHLSTREQKALVKRHKDRISKRLERLGESVHG